MKLESIYLIGFSVIILLIYFFKFIYEYHLSKIQEIKLEKENLKMIEEYKHQCELERQKQKTVVITFLAIVTIKTLVKRNII